MRPFGGFRSHQHHHLPPRPPPPQDFVADMFNAAQFGRLLTSSGDGTLAKLDLTAGKVEARSDDGPDELLSGAQSGRSGRPPSRRDSLVEKAGGPAAWGRRRARASAAADACTVRSQEERPRAPASGRFPPLAPHGIVPLPRPAVVLMKRGKKIVCGSQDGLLSIFDYNDISVRTAPPLRLSPLRRSECRAASQRAAGFGGSVNVASALSLVWRDASPHKKHHSGCGACDARAGFLRSVPGAPRVRRRARRRDGRHGRVRKQRRPGPGPLHPAKQASRWVPRPRQAHAAGAARRARSPPTRRRASATARAGCPGEAHCAPRPGNLPPTAGVVGVHSDFPIERLALSTCKRWVASASHDQSIKIWDIAYLQEADEGGEAAAEGAGGSLGPSPVFAMASCFPELGGCSRSRTAAAPQAARTRTATTTRGRQVAAGARRRRS